MHMGKKIARDILILLGLALLVISNVRKYMEQISNTRNESNGWWGAHHSPEGDLVQMGYLDYVTKFHSLIDYKFVKPAWNGPKHVALYAQGDSYIWKVPDTAYAGITSYKFAWRFQHDLAYTLDTSKRNVLLIEMAERYVRGYFNATGIFNEVYDSAKKAQGLAANIPVRSNVKLAGILPDGISKDDIFNPNINQNLEYNIFNYNFLNPVRSYKALMTYCLFHRASGQVAIADNDDYLLLATTLLPAHGNSSYERIGDKYIGQYVQTLNTIYDHYKADGFDEVYISIIPNPATIVQPKGYNNMIPRIEQSPNLKMKVVSVYDAYRNATNIVYRRGDTHWNNNGLQIWLQKVNEMLAAENHKASR